MKLALATLLFFSSTVAAQPDILLVSNNGDVHIIDSVAGTGTTVANPSGLGANSLARDPVTGIFYTVTFFGGLTSVNPVTGLMTPVAPVANPDVRALAFDAVGTLYAVTGEPTSGLELDFALRTIDVTTGATAILATNLGAIQGLAVEPSTGLFYGYRVGPQTQGLVILDPGSGAVTSVGAATVALAQGLAFDAAGTAFVCGGASLNGLSTMNLVTGAVTPSGTALIAGVVYPHCRGFEFLTPAPRPYSLKISTVLSPLGSSLSIDLLHGSPGASYFTFLTTNSPNFPNGPFFGLDATTPEVLMQLGLPVVPFNGGLDATGRATYSLTLPMPLNVTVFGVSFQYAPGVVSAISNPASAPF